MRWTVHGERPVYSNPWVDLRLVDVELPGGDRFDHHAVRVRPSAGAVVVADGLVLLLWRHRFITDTWGYEIPAGKIEPGETPEVAAAREAEEETGWRPSALRPLLYLQPTPGVSDSEHHVFRADGAVWVGDPEDAAEAERVSWVPLPDVCALIDHRQIVSGSTMASLLYLVGSEVEEK